MAIKRLSSIKELAISLNHHKTSILALTRNKKRTSQVHVSLDPRVDQSTSMTFSLHHSGGCEDEMLLRTRPDPFFRRHK